MFPSGRRLLRAHLDSLLDVPVRVAVPNPRPARFVRILTAGGAGIINPALQDVSLTIESWDDDAVAAEDRANSIRGLLKNAGMWDGWPVYKYREWSPPVDLPDESGQPRFTFTISVLIRTTE